MATIKSFTDLSQSKKLANILPLESADMWWSWYSNPVSNGHYDDFPMFYKPACNPDESVPCWSFASLLSVLPTLDGRNAVLCKDIRYDKWHICYHSTATLSVIDTERYDNPVDACVAMIEKLNELKML